MTAPRQAPLGFKTALEHARKRLDRMGYKLVDVADGWQPHVALATAPRGTPLHIRFIYVSAKRAGSISKAVVAVGALANKVGAVWEGGAQAWFEVWSVHGGHERSKGQRSGGCPFGLGDPSEPHFLVRRRVEYHGLPKWDVVELWPL